MSRPNTSHWQYFKYTTMFCLTAHLLFNSSVLIHSNLLSIVHPHPYMQDAYIGMVKEWGIKVAKRAFEVFADFSEMLQPSPSVKMA